MKKIISIIILVLLVSQVTLGESALVEVTLPGFDIELNGTSIDNTTEEYPFISYNNVTYIPMTWNFSRGLGLESSWDAERGLSIKKSESVEDIEVGTNGNNDMSASYQASLVSFPVSINGMAIDNASEDYPLLSFRDITYFPMTWKYIVDEFGGESKWDPSTGLVVKTNKTVSRDSVSFHGITDEYRDILQEWVMYMKFEDASWWYSLVNYSGRERLMGVFQYNYGLEVTNILDDASKAILLDKSKWSKNIKEIKFTNKSLENYLNERWEIFSPYTVDKIGRVDGLILREDTNLTSLKDLEKFFNLEQITIRGYKGDDLDKLSTFPAIELLILSELAPSDLTFVEDMTQLKGLHITGVKLRKDLDLSRLTNITGIALNNCDLVNLDALDGLTGLTQIDVRNNKLTSLDGIEDNEDLEIVYAYSNQLTDIDALEALDKITHLYLGSNKIKDITSLSGKKHLVHFEANNNDIVDISSLKDSKSLAYVDMIDNDVKDLSPLSDCSNLYFLRMMENSISSLEPLSNLSSLKTANFYDNPISDISPILGCSNLENFDIGVTLVRDITGIKELTNLKQLGMYGLKLDKIDELAYMDNLIELNIPDNLDLTPLTKLTKLDILTYRDVKLDVILNHYDTLLKIINNNPEISIYTDFYCQSNDLGDGDRYKMYSDVYGDYNQVQSGEARKTANKLMDAYKSFIKPGMTDYEKVVATHKFVLETVEYDYENYYSGNYVNVDYSPIKILETGKAVCAGYSRIMELFLGFADVECDYVTGEVNGSDEGHAWNMVKLDGQWYHLDATWDDRGSLNPMAWSLFLISDDEMKGFGQRTWDYERYPTCPDNY
ncbi:hypothetical protein EZV73_22275 [Acidaminobacter sp. JC074]|uniref:leucine-rich repeat domain-containing protein n=1 Tax=Acidaminobacter sp. JC074 TaxID=2530199 RepID=UPI001F10BC85|nr:leucine-rich repeat domain-containing protein [Acidaminobacter sp. JC074]MCH4890326.1 hypothetical protein [Acidaminobacter sp. JC074]